MFQVVIHGRGGQGVVTASELLARSGFAAGRQVQAIPSFGSERMGAPVVAYTRFADSKILTREPILAPDAVIVQDPTLLRTMNVFDGLVPGGRAVVNTRESPNEIRAACPDAPAESGRLATVPADDIVREYLGRPIPSAALLGAFAALTGQITLEALAQSIQKVFKGKVAQGNINSANVAYQWVLDHLGQEDQGAPGGIEHVDVERPATSELPIPIAGVPEVTNA
ncbi:MAG: 2-oxoacid:acceptor oxidoreductase family protein [Bifidobacteriaceae bacterium]|jgi:pyruvate ferredoxin oxidoreductase gamma subunit|nr:2-oxoacid:acceptor oxidoreductase family protein [Bifidobacteriaceae bacterium]